jgi:hypothetical protein
VAERVEAGSRAGTVARAVEEEGTVKGTCSQRPLASQKDTEEAAPGGPKEPASVTVSLEDTGSRRR